MSILETACFAEPSSEATDFPYNPAISIVDSPKKFCQNSIQQFVRRVQQSSLIQELDGCNGVRWFCLGKFTQAKPSGYLSNGLPGDITTEDRQTFNAGNDFELDPVQYPHCNDPIRYFRIVFANTFTTFEYGRSTSNRSVQTGEVTPFGQPIIE